MSAPATVDTLLTYLARLEPDGRIPSDAAEMSAWSVDTWRGLLGELPSDDRSFVDRFQQRRDEVVARLHRWWQARDSAELEASPDVDVAGYLGLLLLSLASLAHSDWYRSTRGAAALSDGPRSVRVAHDCRLLCVPLVRDPAVRQAIRLVYDPRGGGAADHDEAWRLAAREWDGIDFSSLQFHRHGTTSFILRGEVTGATQGERKAFACKYILYPYLRQSTIVRSTREYMAQYSVTDAAVHHLVHIWACTDRWILMDFVPGLTLAEALAQRLADPAQAGSGLLRLDILSEFGNELLLALEELERSGLQHCDLSPSNIIVESLPGGRTRFRLIDLGVNYLYTGSIASLEGPDAAYVAPEIRGGLDGTTRADLYSLGQLLIRFGGTEQTGDGSVPDGFYARTPILARLIEDLIDRDPTRRLLIFRPEPSAGLYAQIREHLNEELAAMRAIAADTKTGDVTWREGFVEILKPLSKMPSKQFRLWRMRRSQALHRDPRRGMFSGYLLGWSLWSALNSGLCAVVLLMFTLRELNLDWAGQLVTLLQRGANASDDDLPVFDSLRHYQVPDPGHNLPVLICGISFLLISIRYYQNLFGAVTPLIVGWRSGLLTVWALVAEFFMRLFTMLSALLILPPVMIQRDWWPFFAALGMTIPLLCNAVCAGFGHLAVRRARRAGVSTLPPGRISGLDTLTGWLPTLTMYVIFLWTIGFLVNGNVLQDQTFYLILITGVNLSVIYFGRCGVDAPKVRAGLGRAFLAAERLRYTAESRRIPEPRATPTAATAERGTIPVS